MSSSQPQPYSRKTILWICGLAVGSFVLAFVLTAFADDLGQPISAGPNTFSYSAVGHRGFLKFLQASGVEVSIRRTERLDSLDPALPLIVIEPKVSLSDNAGSPALGRLLDAATIREVPLVVVLPKWGYVINPGRPRWILDSAPIDPRGVRNVLTALEDRVGSIPETRLAASGTQECETAWGDPVTVSLSRGVVFQESDGLEPIVACSRGLLIARSENEYGEVTYIVSDPDILNNHGLGTAGHAGLIEGFFTGQLDTQRITLDETVHGFTRSNGLIAELFRFPLVLALVHGTMLLGLVVWAGVGRFGKPRPMEAPLGSGKYVLIDNTAKLLSVVGHTSQTLPRYFKQTVRGVAAHYFLPADLPTAKLLPRLEQIAKAREIDVDLQELHRLIDELAHGTRRHGDKAVKLALTLHRWRQGMMHVG